MSNGLTLDENASELAMSMRVVSDFPAMQTYSKGSANGDNILKNYYGIQNPEMLSDYCVIIPQNDCFKEVAVFIVGSENDKNKKESLTRQVLSAINSRYDLLKNLYEKKNPEDRFFEKTVVLCENAVVFILCSEKESIEMLKALDNNIYN